MHLHHTIKVLSTNFFAATDRREYDAIIARPAAYTATHGTRDDLLDCITHYWLTNTGISAARFYWESHANFYLASSNKIQLPVAVSAFPGENYQLPRSWAESAYSNLIYYNRPKKGGHFAAWEQPELFADELRAGLRPLRAKL